MLNELTGTRLRKITQTITYMPHFISAVVICGLMLDFCKTNGVITSVFTAITGQEASNMFSHSAYFQPLYVLMCIWQEFGWDSIIYFAAISGVNPELYEAAIVDGAGRWKKMFFITLPCIAPTIIVLLIMRIGWLLSVGFEKIILMYNEATYETADVISTYVYRVGLLNSDFSYGTAIGLFNCVVSLVLIILANGLSRKFSDTSLF